MKRGTLLSLGILLLLALAAFAPDPLDLPVDPSTHAIVETATPVKDSGQEGDPRDEPPPVFYGEEIDTENATLVYVVDCSGSMLHADRLEKAQAELRKSIAALSPNFSFNVVQYPDCTVRSLWPKAQSATASNKAQAIGYVNALRASGSTATGPAVVVALSDLSCMAVVLLTDGAPNCGLPAETHRQMIRTKNVQGATVNVFGVAASGAYREFCQAVAADSGGSYYDVP